MIRLPGLIDPHVHPRGLPSDRYKEDFLTATSAALAGGYTTIFDMPNNPKTPTLTYDLLQDKQAIAKSQIVCDTGFFFGTNGKNLNEFENAAKETLGLKVFLSFSTANLVIDITTFKDVVKAWPTKLPILLHAEQDTIKDALGITHDSGHRTHICHVSSAFELQQVIEAKEKGFTVTCGVTPHHLFLSEENGKQLGPFGLMKPSLKPIADVTFLWEHLDEIDVIESDHAPHTRDEKQSQNPPFGVPGLETTLALLLTAVHDDKLTIEDIIRLCFDNPKKIFLADIPYFSSDQSDTFIEIHENEEWTVENEKLFTKSAWSPFNGRKLRGRVKQVFLRGTKVFENNTILAKPGFGKIIKI